MSVAHGAQSAGLSGQPSQLGTLGPRVSDPVGRHVPLGQRHRRSNSGDHVLRRRASGGGRVSATVARFERGRWRLNECDELHPVAAVASLEVAGSDGGEHIGGRTKLGVSANGDAGHGRVS